MSLQTNRLQKNEAPNNKLCGWLGATTTAEDVQKRSLPLTLACSHGVMRVISASCLPAVVHTTAPITGETQNPLSRPLRQPLPPTALPTLHHTPLLTLITRITFPTPSPFQRVTFSPLFLPANGQCYVAMQIRSTVHKSNGDLDCTAQGGERQSARDHCPEKAPLRSLDASASLST